MGLQQAFIRVNEFTYPHYYLCNYLPVSAGRDRLSHSLLLFKRGEQPDLDGWIDCSLTILAEGLSQCSPGLFSGGTIIRALHHNETTAGSAGPVSLDQLGRALALRFDCRYAPHLLLKSRVTRPIKAFTRQQRESELGDTYYIEVREPPGAEGRPFLIIDDILTTATTVRMIIAVVRERFPGSPLFVFTLARADYDAGPNRSTPLKGQHYQLEQDTDWLVAEEGKPYYSGELLKAWIGAGRF
ncbi:MAG TPA: phosphoribosyltransferase [Puia sp.]|nr:phosphoribosyltransferase [Puia sp.]